MDFFPSRVVENLDLGAGYSLLRLAGCESLQGALPGQFAMLRGAWGRDPILPRAYSILGVGETGEAEFLVRQVGRGSRLLGQSLPGAMLTTLGPLGNSFPAPDQGIHDLLVAGGCGLPPLHMAALLGARVGSVEVLLGARRSEELVQPLIDRLEQSGVTLHLITEDGSRGECGLVTDLLERRLQGQTVPVRVMACGPTAMLRAVREVTRRFDVRCYLSLEAEMACGLGACLGCAVERREQGRGPYAHVCADGPVFDAEEIWP